MLLLDEPTAGLDIKARAEILEVVRGLVANEGIGVLWTTHLVDEIRPPDFEREPPAVLVLEPVFGRLRAAVAHELPQSMRQPLAVIRMEMKGVRKGAADSSRVKPRIRSMHEFR